MKRSLVVAALLLLVGGSGFLSAQDKSDAGSGKKEKSAKAKQEAPAALNFKMKSIEGKEIDLEKYKGSVVLIVNTASKCGMTPQYAELQKLHEKYADQGLKILGFPCNQFGKQEPGSNEDIAVFCEQNYGVEFDMFSKIDVKADDQAGLYKYLTNLDLQPKGKGDVRWNFEKFVIDRSGKPIARFGTRVSPDDKKLVETIVGALKAK